MSRTINTPYIFKQGVQLPGGSAAGLVATSDASGNVSWGAAPEEWTTLQRVSSYVTTPGGTTAYMLAELGASTGWLQITGSLLNVPSIRLDAADYAVTGRTLQLRLLTTIKRNAITITNNTVTFGLLLVSATAGVSGVLTGTVGTTLSGGPKVAFANPAASSILKNSDAVTPADATVTFNSTNVPAGEYIFGATMSGGGTPGSGSVIKADLLLQVRNQ